MSDDKRYILFGGSDGPFNARDNVIHYLVEEIDSCLDEDESAFLNYAAAYLRTLIAIIRDVDGAALVEDRITGWETQALRTYDAMENPPEEIAVDRPFLESLFCELRKLAHESP